MPTSPKSPATASTPTRPPPRDRQPLSSHSLVLVTVLFGVTIIAIVIAVAMARHDILHDTLSYEIGKLVAQAGILTGFGALVTLLTHEFQQDQEQSRQRVEAASQLLSIRAALLRDFAARVTDAYTNLKQARRRLQWARSQTSEGTLISTDVYEKQLKRISAVQAEFETLRTLAQTSFVDGNGGHMVDTHLKGIADRLSKLISERKIHPTASSPLMSLDDREAMKSFTAESEQADFKGVDGFGATRADYKAILAWILDELREPRLQ